MDFFQADDLSFLDNVDGFKNLQRVGVELFQFEIFSAVNVNHMIKKADLARIEKLFWKSLR
jgi:hypothetical protein